MYIVCSLLAPVGAAHSLDGQPPLTVYVYRPDNCGFMLETSGPSMTTPKQFVEISPPRHLISLEIDSRDLLYWNGKQINFDEFTALLSSASRIKPMPYIMISGVGGGSRADYAFIEDYVTKSPFCTTPGVPESVNEVIRPNTANSPTSPPPPAASAPPTKASVQPVPQSPKSGVAANFRAPVSPVRVNSGFFDRNYPPEQSRQHLGVDLAAAVGVQAHAPVSGRVMTNRTNDPNVMQAFLVIRGSDGTEHVLGHIASSLRVGAFVQIGQSVGIVRAWPGCPTCSHVHWGINRKGIGQAAWGDWGWGRAPLTATRAQAAARGWVDPLLGGK